MSIVRVAHKHHYVAINTTALNDHRLSFKAKGLHSYLLSRPDGWQVNIRHLATVSQEGREAVASAMQELLTYGYATRHLPRDVHGKLTGYETVIYETPITGFTASAELTPANAALLSIEEVSIEEGNNHNGFFEGEKTRKRENISAPLLTQKPSNERSDPHDDTQNFTLNLRSASNEPDDDLKNDPLLTHTLTYYQHCYQTLRGKPHPRLKPAQHHRILGALADFYDRYGIEDAETVEVIVDRHFARDQHTDGNLNAFAHESVLEAIALELEPLGWIEVEDRWEVGSRLTPKRE